MIVLGKVSYSLTRVALQQVCLARYADMRKCRHRIRHMNPSLPVIQHDVRPPYQVRGDADLLQAVEILGIPHQLFVSPFLQCWGLTVNVLDSKLMYICFQFQEVNKNADIGCVSRQVTWVHIWKICHVQMKKDCAKSKYNNTLVLDYLRSLSKSPPLKIVSLL